MTKRNSKQPDLAPFLESRMMPYNIEAEASVIGHMLMTSDSMDSVAEIIKNADFFYKEEFKRIYRAALMLWQRGRQIDLVTIMEELKKDDSLQLVGGPVGISSMMGQVLGPIKLETHCKVIAEKYMLRELVKTGAMITDAALNNDDPFDLIDRAESAILKINSFDSDDVEPVSSVVVEAMHRLDEIRKEEKDFTGVDSGFPEVNKLTGGWQQPDLIILAARPSVGKTAFALNLARNAAKAGTPVAFFSLEMSSVQLVQRILSAESNIHLEKISRGKLEQFEMEELHTKGFVPVSELPLFIDQTGAINIFELRAKCRRMKAKNNIGLIIIDYLQLMSGVENSKANNREQEISKISRDLKALAKELQVPIIALSQLSREVEKRKEGSKRPQLSDLRESGAIEQDADVVIFMYRPEYYEIKVDEGGEKLNGETEFRWAKHRSGKLETIRLKAQLEIQKFVSMENQVGYTRPAAVAGQNWKPITMKLEDGEEEDYKF